MTFARFGLAGLAAFALVVSCNAHDGTPPAAARIDELRARFPRADLPLGDQPGTLRKVDVALARHAAGQTRIDDSSRRVSVGFRLVGASSAEPRAVDGYALYPAALDGFDVVHRVHAEGIEDYVVFDTAPKEARLRYEVDVTRVPGLRLVANTLEFLDDRSSPVLRIAPPWVVDATGVRKDAHLALGGCRYDADPSPPWGRPLTAPGAASCVVVVSWKNVVYPAIVDPAWGATGSMAKSRFDHTATVLASGRVLIVGGNDNTDAAGLVSAEVFDPTANGGVGAFAATGSMGSQRTKHTATVLSSGKVLVTGGGYNGIREAEIYDPVTGAFTPTGLMNTERTMHSASLLSSGKVLIAGGERNLSSLATAELFDPTANAGVGGFSATETMAAARHAHTATVLGSGKVLIAAGRVDFNGTTAEIFDPVAGSFALSGSTVRERNGHTATLLPSGKVLIAGGDASVSMTSLPEVFDPAANGGLGAFAASASMTYRSNHSATLLPSGTVLVVGGQGPTFNATKPSDLFDAAGAGSFAAGPSLVTARFQHTASALPNGKVLVVGGLDNDRKPLASAEIFGGKPGDTCASGGECLSRICTDGVCCDSDCVGSCNRCNIAGHEGTCTLELAGSAGTAPACSPFACDGASTTCPTICTTDTMCEATRYCAADGTCQPRKAQAAACNIQSDCKEVGCRACTTNHCVDGVCCDSACDGTCLACAAALKEGGLGDGTCGPAKDGLDPRNQCEPSNVVCGADGACDGTGGCRLVARAGISCGAGSCEGNVPKGDLCDGQGACVKNAGGEDCSPRKCIGGGCAPTPSCAVDADCAPDAFCNAGTCEKRVSDAVCDGEHTITGSDAIPHDCSPYRCESNGTCRTRCNSVEDCVSPLICDLGGSCRELATDASDGGCAMARVGTPSPETQLGWLLSIVGVLGLRRRRKSCEGSAT